MTKSPRFEVTEPEQPFRKTRIETYLWDTQNVGAMDIAETFHDPNKKLASTVVLVPVASTQEVNSVGPALLEYAKQSDCDPFTVLLYLNRKNGSTDDQIANAVLTSDIANASKVLLSDYLDVRVATGVYDDLTIGGVRKDLWDAALMLAYSEGRFDRDSAEVIGINHDIDTHSIDPHYIRNIQREYLREQAGYDDSYLPRAVLPPRYTRVRHSLPKDTHPNTAKGIYWVDFTIDQDMPFHGYEEGLVIPFSLYAKQGGFSRSATTYETQPMTTGRTSIPTIAGTNMLTSPRRYIDRFPTHGFSGIWTDETFGDNDACRDTLGRDATSKELKTHVDTTLDSYVYNRVIDPAVARKFSSFVRPTAQGILTDRALDNFIEQTRVELNGAITTSVTLAKNALLHIELDGLAKKLPNSKDVRAIVADYLERIYSEVRDMNADIWLNR